MLFYPTYENNGKHLVWNPGEPAKLAPKVDIHLKVFFFVVVFFVFCLREVIQD